MFGFENLEVWKVSVKYAQSIYQITSAFPTDERFGLTNQLRRASVSISSNIAEGSGRGSNKDFIRFIQIAYSSLMETVSQLAIAREQSFISVEDYKELYLAAEKLARMLSGLRRSLH